MYIMYMYTNCILSTTCVECTSKLIFYKVDHRSEVNCPKCHTVTPVPDRNVDKLPKNFGLIEVISSSATPHHHSALTNSPQLSGHESNDRAIEHPVCKVHKDHISSYCTEDDTLVCSSCLLYGVHKGHQCLLATEAAELERAKLRRLNPEVDKQRERMQNTLGLVEDNLQKVEKNGGW